MRLTTFQDGRRAVPGLVGPAERIVPLAEVWPDEPVPRDMLDVIEAWDRLGTEVMAAAERLDASAGVSVAELDSAARWCPPVPRPSKVLGVALNNGGLSGYATVMPEHPMLFCYPPSALTGHRKPIEIRPDYGLTHPEPELAVIIGRRVKDLAPEDALTAVFGYTIIDDITSVDLKSGDTTVFPRSFADIIGGSPAKPGQPPRGFEHGDLHLTYHARSKGTDTFAPCGPWIVTADEINDPQKLAVTLSIDDELCTEDNTANLVYSVSTVVSHASRYFTLEPGDILHIGTAAKGKYRLRDIDYQQRTGTRTIEIEGLGALVNPIQHLEERPTR